MDGKTRTPTCAYQGKSQPCILAVLDEGEIRAQRGEEGVATFRRSLKLDAVQSRIAAVFAMLAP